MRGGGTMRTNAKQWAHSNKCNLLKSNNLAYIYWAKGVRFKRRKGSQPLAGGYYFETTRRLKVYEKHLLPINEFYKMKSLQDIESARKANKKKGKSKNERIESSKN